MTALIVRCLLPLIILLSQVPAAAPIRVLNRVRQQEDELKTLDHTPGTYVSLRDLSRVLAEREPFVNRERQKMVLYIGDHRIKVSGQTSYLIIDERVFQMPTPALVEQEDIFLPAEPLFIILRQTVFPGLTYDPQRGVLDIDRAEFNIKAVAITEKANGTILRIYTRESFPEANISSFAHENGWFYLTVAGGQADTTEIRKTDTRGVIRRVAADQLGQTSQLAFLLRGEIESHEVYQSSDPSAIVVTLRSPLSKSAARIKDVRDRWRLDTVILDAGHGGKDSGTRGRNGTKEKNITLDIVKRVGLLLEKNTHIKVIFTREEDVFVPLWKRTRIANESNGKVFVSVHVNASPDRTVKGFETYLLRPGKTADAIEVAARENAVIKLEEKSQDQYAELTGENLIMATMAQSMFMKESEDLAAVIQEELARRVPSSNRGVKQAGFYVLIGASMPNVLAEVGYLSNPSEEQNLRKPAYRRKLAEGIYAAIVRFKRTREAVLAEG